MAEISFIKYFREMITEVSNVFPDTKQKFNILLESKLNNADPNDYKALILMFFKTVKDMDFCNEKDDVTLESIKDGLDIHKNCVIDLFLYTDINFADLFLGTNLRSQRALVVYIQVLMHYALDMIKERKITNEQIVSVELPNIKVIDTSIQAQVKRAKDYLGKVIGTNNKKVENLTNGLVDDIVDAIGKKHNLDEINKITDPTDLLMKVDIESIVGDVFDRIKSRAQSGELNINILKKMLKDFTKNIDNNNDQISTILKAALASAMPTAMGATPASPASPASASASASSSTTLNDVVSQSNNIEDAIRIITEKAQGKGRATEQRAHARRTLEKRAQAKTANAASAASTTSATSATNVVSVPASATSATNVVSVPASVPASTQAQVQPLVAPVKKTKGKKKK